MRRTLAALALAALLLPTTAFAAPDATVALPQPPAEAQVCHGPTTSNTCSAIVNTVFGVAVGAARFVDGVACNLGSCGFLLTNLVIFLYRNLP